METMKELDQTSKCYICGQESTYARPWAMATGSQEEFNVSYGISVACSTHDREAIAQVLTEVEIKEGLILSYFGIAEIERIEKAFRKATSLGEKLAAVYGEDE